MMTMIKNTYIPIKNCDHSTNCSLLLYRLALIFPLFFFYGYGDHRDLHSFPTRRSSDLGAHPHVPVTEALQRLPRPARQPRDALHRAHPLGQLRQHRGLVPAAGAHLQNLLPPAELQQLRHAADDEGLRDRLPLPDRQRVVPVRPIAERLVHEHVARQPSHHLDHPRVSDPARDQLLLHHPLALAREPRRARLRLRAARHRLRFFFFFSTAFSAPSHSVIRPSAPWCVRSRCSGVTDAYPSCTAAISALASSAHSGGPAPIQ